MKSCTCDFTMNLCYRQLEGLGDTPALPRSLTARHSSSSLNCPVMSQTRSKSHWSNSAMSPLSLFALVKNLY